MKPVRRTDILTLGLEGNSIGQGANKDGTQIAAVHITLKLAPLTCFLTFFFQVEMKCEEFKTGGKNGKSVLE